MISLLLTITGCSRPGSFLLVRLPEILSVVRLGAASLWAVANLGHFVIGVSKYEKINSCVNF